MSARRIEYLPLDEVVGAAHNPRRHADDTIRAGLQAFGLADLPIVDDRTGRLVAGHGRIKLLRELRAAGSPRPRYVKQADDGTWLIPVYRGVSFRSDAHAGAYVLMNNESSVAGGWDTDELVAVLGDMDEGHVVLSGYTEADIDRLLEGAKGPDDEPDAKPLMDPGVFLVLPDEATQEQAFADLVGQGYTVRVVNT